MIGSDLERRQSSSEARAAAAEAANAVLPTCAATHGTEYRTAR
jgi:hypothetical protein